MKKVFLFLLLSCMSFVSIQAQAYQQEKLGRAPVAVLTSKGVLVSWRSLVGDASNLGFNVYRDGVRLNSEVITTSTNFLDDGGVALQTTPSSPQQARVSRLLRGIICTESSL